MTEKRAGEFESFLRFYEVKNNPFLNKNFDVMGMDTYTDGNKTHRFFDIRLIYESNTLKICFNKKDYILGFFLFYLTVKNIFAFDPNWKTFLNKKQFNYSYETLLTYLKSDLLENNEFLIEYSDTEDGLNAFTVAKQLIWFPITEWYDDLYYFHKEIKRWEKENIK